MDSGRHEVWRRILEHSPGMIILLDRDLRIRWINRAVTETVGWTNDNILGRPVLEYVDPTWDPLAFDSIATGIESPGARPSMPVRAFGADGTETILEVSVNNQFDDPVIASLVVHARPWTERWLLDQILDAMAAEVPAQHSLELLVRVAGAETLQAQASVLTDLADGRATTIVSADGLDDPLAGPSALCTADVVDAWASILASPVEQVLTVDALPAVLAGPARVRGLQSLWVWPYEHARQSESRVWTIAWRRERPMNLDETRRLGMTRLARLAGLIIDGERRRNAVEYAASHDALTGLVNRATFRRRLQSSLDGLPLHGIAVGYIDLDSFKPVNDRFGHAAGDRVLGAVGSRLAAVAGEAGCQVARLGGDEFGLIAPTASIAWLMNLGERIRNAVAAPIELRAGEIVTVGASVGFSCRELGDDTSLDRLIERADAALYDVKNAGGGVKVDAVRDGLGPPLN